VLDPALDLASPQSGDPEARLNPAWFKAEVFERIRRANAAAFQRLLNGSDPRRKAGASSVDLRRPPAITALVFGQGTDAMNNGFRSSLVSYGFALQVLQIRNWAVRQYHRRSKSGGQQQPRMCQTH
jgi:hypothetical protein